MTSSSSHNQVFPERIPFHVHLHRPAEPFYRISECPVIYQQHFKKQSFLNNSKTFQITHTFSDFKQHNAYIDQVFKQYLYTKLNLLITATLSVHTCFLVVHQIMYDVYIKLLLLKEDCIRNKPVNTLFRKPQFPSHLPVFSSTSDFIPVS